MWLDARELLGAQALQPRHSVRSPSTFKVIEPGQLGRGGGDDDLAATLVRDPTLLAELVQLARAINTQLRLERARCIVDAGVHHAGVVPRLVKADLGFSLED